MSAAWGWDRSVRPQKGHDSRGRLTTQTGYSYSVKGGPAPARPPREFFESQSYDMAPPPRQPPPMTRNMNTGAYRSSAFRPTSSIYSQPSPVTNNPSAAPSAPGYRHGGGGDYEISPPSSPEPSYVTSSGPRAAPGRSRDVSPIDDDMAAMSLTRGNGNGNGNSYGRESPAMNQQQPGATSQSQSNIPMMRRARRKQSDAALREAHSRDRGGGAQRQVQQQTGDVRWDTMTGEPTSSATGMQSQVKPAEFARGLGANSSSAQSPPPPPQQQQQVRSPTAAITAFGDRVRRMAQQGRGGDKKTPDMAPVERRADPAAGAFTSSRPGWRGASGRTTLVEPVRDDTRVAPLKIPRKSSKRVASPPAASGGAPMPPLISGMPASGLAESGNPPGPPGGQNSQSSQLFTTASDGADAPALGARALHPPLAGGSASVSPGVAMQQAVRRKPPPAHADLPRQSPSSSVRAMQDPPADPWVQPASRFSVTTYATSAAATTPRQSLDDNDRPPMPTPPQNYRTSPAATQPKKESVMDRQRPKLGGQGDNDHVHSSGGSPIVISLKDSFMTSPFGNQSGMGPRERKPVGTDVTSTRDADTSSILTTEKSLPPAPPEAQAGEARDRVALLNAQLQSLGNRRINLLRSVQQMTELKPRDGEIGRESAEVIYRRGAERKAKVEVLRQELAEVQRLEHELGLKLHRAYKRRDREEQWESSALWVRRVTE